MLFVYDYFSEFTFDRLSKFSLQRFHNIIDLLLDSLITLAASVNDISEVFDFFLGLYELCGQVVLVLPKDFGDLRLHLFSRLRKDSILISRLSLFDLINFVIDAINRLLQLETLASHVVHELLLKAVIFLTDKLFDV